MIPLSGEVHCAGEVRWWHELRGRELLQALITWRRLWRCALRTSAWSRPRAALSEAAFQQYRDLAQLRFNFAGATLDPFPGKPVLALHLTQPCMSPSDPLTSS